MDLLNLGVRVQKPVMKNQSASGAEEDSRVGTGAMGRLTARSQGREMGERAWSKYHVT